MFRRSVSSNSPDLFSNFEWHFSRRKQRQLNDPKSWHNLVHEHITSKIDEDRFAVLYDPDTGRPNAPIRQLVTMMIMKEGFGWSDEQLFEECRFNVLAMRALGLMNLSDEIPTESTYYLFKQLHYAYQREKGQDLIGETFAALTKTQAKLFGVTGERIRMDSKLIGSNIATCCRLQLILSCLQAFWRSLSDPQQQQVAEEDRQVLDTLGRKQPQQVVYRLSSEEKRAKLEALGLLLARLVETFQDGDSDKYRVIRRVLEEQYAVSDQHVLPRASRKIAAASLQSAHDEDAAYRKKHDQQVKGYSVNLTETCNEEGLNLVTDLAVAPATAADQGFVTPAIAETEAVVGPVKEVSMDGGYQSVDNWHYAQSHGKRFYYGGMAGERSRFSYKRTPDGAVEVMDTQRGDVLESVAYQPGKYRFVVDGKTRYITDQTLENQDRRTKVEQLPDRIRRRRHNVEASLFQLSYHTRNNKTRYRRLSAHQTWAYCRASWMNLVRIQHYLTRPEKPAQSMATRAQKGARWRFWGCKPVAYAFIRSFFLFFLAPLPGDHQTRRRPLALSPRVNHPLQFR